MTSVNMSKKGFVPLNQDEIKRLKSFLSELETPTTVTTSLAYSGMFSFPLSLGKSQFSFGFNASDKPYNQYWILDSGATDHMTPLPTHFSTYSPCPSNKKISTADGTLLTVAGQGDVQISPSIILRNVLHIPKLSTSLISIQKLTKNLSCNAIFNDNACVFQDKHSGRTIGNAREWNDLYYLDNRNLPPNSLNNSFFSESIKTNREKVFLYHSRLGHPSFRVMKQIFPSFFKNLDVESLCCEVCELAKHKRASFPVSTKVSTSPFYLIHTDVWGPSNVPNISGARWFVIFIDDCTRVTWVYLLRQKSEVTSVFLHFFSMVKNQFGVSIKRVRSDNAKDYFNHGLNSFCQKEGIIHESSCVKTPQQNGIAERKNRHLLDQTRAILFQNKVPKKYWGEAVLTASYLINRLPSSVLASKTPMEVLSSFYPDVSTSCNLIPRIFGCKSFVHIHSDGRGKLDPRALKCVFIGYSSTQKGYKCYHPPSHKFFVSRDVTFHEQESYFVQTHLQGENTSKEDESLVLPDLNLGPDVETEIGPENVETKVDNVETEIESEKDGNVGVDVRYGKNLVYTRKKNIIPEFIHIHESDPTLHEVTFLDPSNSSDSISEFSHAKEPESNMIKYKKPKSREVTPIQSKDSHLPIAHRKDTRTCTNKPLYPLSNYLCFEQLSPTHKAFLTNLNTTTIPTSLSEALSDRKWKQAMDLEMEALDKNNTWELVSLPTGKKPVGCKWVYTIKYKADGSIERYKARLVAKGFTQTYGVDYSETFAPVAKMNTVRVILSLAANYNWNLQQFDVKNAFLHGELEEEIYMDVPPGYREDMTANAVCRLKKALYGLKQSPRAWFGRFTKVMVGLGFKQSQGDHTLFVKHSESGGVTVLLVYVDDIIVTGDDEEEQQMLAQHLAKEFEIKTLGKLKYFLGIEVAHSRKGIFISQQKYITDLLQETGKTACKPACTPIDPNVKLGNAEEDIAVNKEMYQRLVGKLIYLSHTRLDVAFAVSLVSQFMHQPKEIHLQAALRIVQYLKGTPGRGILFERNGSVGLEAYTDAYYAGSIVDRRSTTGYCTFLGGNLVTWKSKK
ncbi:putative mitochondrial protein [Trifolium repens]|nr:putative mitochondrial protein [Trifolium repens]